ncbi:MAG TPA: hypothetical protein VF772_08995 [Terriglobales bacterium]
MRRRMRDRQEAIAIAGLRVGAVGKQPPGIEITSQRSQPQGSRQPAHEELLPYR